MKYDYLIVGSGLFGATFAYLAHKAGKSCLVIDQRKHTGGNVHCERIADINVHSYGAHIFHTSDEEVWQFVNSLVPFNRFTNCPLALYRGKLYNLPFNMNTFCQMWGVTTPAEALSKLSIQRAEAARGLKAAGATEPRNLEEQAKLLVGGDVYERLIKGYTEKQWGRECKQLPAFIIKRLPVRFTFNNNYFNDAHQGIPKGGYNVLIDELLKGADVLLRTPLHELDCRKTKSGTWQFHRPAMLTCSADDTVEVGKIVYSGAIDEYFDYRLGKLEYRSIHLQTEVMDTPNYQGNAVVNYTDASVPFTRIIEHKHFEMFGDDVYRNPKTVVSREFSEEWQPGMEPYYPVNDERNNRLADKYRELAARQENVIFGGRLAEYRYYDMAPVIRRAMEAFKQQNV